MDDFLILLQAKLDEAKSKGNVNTDIDKLQGQLDKLKIQAELDPKVISNLTKQLEKVLNQKIVIPNIGIDTKSGAKAGQEYGKQFGQQAITNIKEKISTLKKEQSNIASTQIFNTKDLDSQGKIYIQKVNNTIEKTRSELESKLRNAGYMDIQIKGVEDTTGKVKSLTATVTDATGAFKQLNFERAKIQGNGKAQAGFVQSDDVKIVGNISSAIDKVQNNLSSLKIKWEEQGVLIGDFKTNVEQLESSLSSVGSKGELNGLKLQIQDLKNEAATLSHINEIQLSIDNGHGASEYQNRIQSLINDFQKYGIAAETAKTQTASLQQIFDNMKGMSGQELVNQADKFEQEFKAVKISIDEAKLSYDKLLQPVSDEKISSLIIKINSFLKANTAITQDSKLQLENYVKELSGKNINLEKWNSINNEFIKIKANMSVLDKLGKSLKDQFLQAAGTLTQYFSIARGFSFLLNQFQQIPRKVIAVNSAMVELNKVSDASASEIKKYFSEAAKSAKDLGSSVSDVITATADFSRLGYSLPDSAELARVATLYKNVGDGIDINEASSSIVSTMKAFKIEAENAISIVDKFNQVGNDFAISSGEIGDALKRSASSLAVSGNTISESIGLITAGNTVVQDADTVGTALKTLSLRITSTSAELEELGEDTEFACETLSDYRDLVMGLTHNKVDIIGTDGDYKSTYQMLKEISKVWEDMNSMEQSSLMKALFGARQANIGASILENFDVAEAAMQTAEDAAGSALKEQEKYEKGIQYSLDRIEASFQTFSNNILDSDFLKGIVDFGNTTINVLDTVTSKLGSFGTISTIGSGIASAKGLGLTNYVTIMS